MPCRAKGRPESNSLIQSRTTRHCMRSQTADAIANILAVLIGLAILALFIGGPMLFQAYVHKDWRCAFAQCRIEK